MKTSKEKSIKKLLKVYPIWSLPIRRFLANLFRYKKNTIFSRVDPMAYIMIILFLITAIPYIINGNILWTIPFIFGCVFLVFNMIYFRFYPLSWAEMTDEEKVVYRKLWQYPMDWEPQI